MHSDKPLPLSISTPIARNNVFPVIVPAVIHMWYKIPIPTCYICKEVHSSVMINIVDNCFLCELCYVRYRSLLQHERISTESVTALFSKNLPRSRTLYIQYPCLDLEDIVMAYNIAYPAIYTFRIVFIWRRYSPPRKEPGVDYWELTYVLVYKSYRSIRYQNKLFPGSGRMHIVAEKHLKMEEQI